MTLKINKNTHEKNINRIKDKVSFFIECLERAFPECNDPCSERYSPILKGQLDHIKGAGEFEGDGFFQQF